MKRKALGHIPILSIGEFLKKRMSLSRDREIVLLSGWTAGNVLKSDSVISNFLRYPLMEVA